MANIDIHASQWRFVEVGRVVLFTHGLYKDRLAAIVEIIDHKRVRINHTFPIFVAKSDLSHRLSSMAPPRKTGPPSLVNQSPSTT